MRKECSTWPPWATSRLSWAKLLLLLWSEQGSFTWPLWATSRLSWAKLPLLFWSEEGILNLTTM